MIIARFIFTATTGDGHCSEVPPIHAVLKTSFCSHVNAVEDLTLCSKRRFLLLKKNVEVVCIFFSYINLFILIHNCIIIIIICK